MPTTTSGNVTNTRNKNVDTTPRYKNDNQTEQFRNQRAINVAGARETVGNAESQNGLNTPQITRKRCVCGNKTEKVYNFKQKQSDWLATTMKKLINQEFGSTLHYMCKVSRRRTKKGSKALSDPVWVDNNAGGNTTVQTAKGHKNIPGLCFIYGIYGLSIGCQKCFPVWSTLKRRSMSVEPPGFEDPEHPDKVYKIVKALYGLHQAPRAWYDTLANYLLCNGFQRGKIDQTLFIKRQQGHILLVQIYVDDIIFGSTKKELCDEFEKLMKDNLGSRMEMAAEFMNILLTNDRIFDVPLQSTRQDISCRKPSLGLLDSKILPLEILLTLTVTMLGANEDRKVNHWTEWQIAVQIKDTIECPRQFRITEASLRRHLKLDDQDGITSIPNSDIFEQLTLMGYHTDLDKLTFQRGAFSPQIEVSYSQYLSFLSQRRLHGSSLVVTLQLLLSV
ncbi:putative ribonuclease H-like domain-containing protein [Tanacetum coccineum]